MKRKERTLGEKQINSYTNNLRDQERAESTVKQYTSYLCALSSWLGERLLTKQELISWKKQLSQTYAVATVNAMLVGINGFLRFMGWNDMVIKPLKTQRTLFRDESRELHYQEYERLVHTAKQRGDMRLSLLIQTICATGIRVSELEFITVEAVERGRTEVNNKGKRRMIFLPEKLRRVLKHYAHEKSIHTGAIFVTRTGAPLDRSNIWRNMKGLCIEAGVDPSKVFPHNLRHLFARKFYAKEKDADRLADILGHASINTTRIYTAESGLTHIQLMNQLDLVITT